jgi:hypothetical protein
MIFYTWYNDIMKSVACLGVHVEPMILILHRLATNGIMIGDDF